MDEMRKKNFLMKWGIRLILVTQFLFNRLLKFRIKTFLSFCVRHIKTYVQLMSGYTNFHDNFTISSIVRSICAQRITILIIIIYFLMSKNLIDMFTRDLFVSIFLTYKIRGRTFFFK